MKFALLGLILSSGSFQNATTAEGTIEGRVLSAGSGEPLANTPVTLISSQGLSDEALAKLLDQISQQVSIGLQGGGGGGSQDLTIRAVANIDSFCPRHPANPGMSWPALPGSAPLGSPAILHCF